MHYEQDEMDGSLHEYNHDIQWLRKHEQYGQRCRNRRWFGCCIGCYPLAVLSVKARVLPSVRPIGTAVGAGTGALIGKKMDKAAAEAKQIEGAQVEQITDNNGLQP